MKSFFALALLGALANADAKADDAAAKKAVVDKVDYGKSIPPLSKAIPLKDVVVSTGGKEKCTIKMSTGVKITGGSDSQTYFQFLWEVVPTADYDPVDAAKKIAFAAGKDAFAEKSAYAEFRNSKKGDLDVINYNFMTLNTSVTDLAARTPVGGELTDAENTELLKNQFYWTTVNG